MTENRFSVYGKEIVQGDECWAVAYSEYNADVIATALNELSEERDYFERKKEYFLSKWSIAHTENIQLRQKNEELKSEYSEQCIQLDFLKDENQHMRDLVNENEQLKEELKVYRKVASCSNCKYHNYDWDIDDGYGGEEYEVCDKGNDITEGICEEWEEL